MASLTKPIAVLALITFSSSYSNWSVGLETPACDKLARWAMTIDANDRWEPVTANKRIWLPRAMSETGFTDLFGKPALEWSQDDVAAARNTWSGCIQLAKRARDNDLRSLLQDSRRYLTSNLRDLARYHDQEGLRSGKEQQIAQQQNIRQMQQERVLSASSVQQATESIPGSSHPGVKRAVDALLNVPPSLDGLIALGSLSRLDLSDKRAMDNLEKQFGYTTGAAGKEAYRIMRELRIRGITGYGENEVPRIVKRLEEIKPTALEEFTKAFSQAPTDPYTKRSMQQRYEKVMQQLELALPEDEYQAFAEAARQEHLASVEQVVIKAKTSIDSVKSGFEGIARIDNIVNEAAKSGLNSAQRADLLTHASARQQQFANQVLIEAEKELPTLPNTLEGIRKLSGISNRMLRGVVQKADKNVIQKFVDASDARLAEIGQAALPEYERALAKLPENEDGLARAEREVKDKEGWLDLEEGLRGDYAAIAKSRRDEIYNVVSKTRAQKEATLKREFKAAIAAGGDPRLVGTEWVETNKTIKYEFRDEKTVFINALGIKAAGTYEISRNDVVVKGPHGQLVYTLDGNRLTGMGLTFVKQSD